MFEPKEISTGELLNLVESGKAPNIIDVREDHEVATGIIPGATHIRMGEIPAHLDELDKDKQYYIICHAGARSANVCDFLNDKGYKATNIAGGMSSWFGEKVF